MHILICLTSLNLDGFMIRPSESSKVCSFLEKILKDCSFRAIFGEVTGLSSISSCALEVLAVPSLGGVLSRLVDIWSDSGDDLSFGPNVTSPMLLRSNAFVLAGAGIGLQVWRALGRSFIVRSISTSWNDTSRFLGEARLVRRLLDARTRRTGAEIESSSSKPVIVPWEKILSLAFGPPLVGMPHGQQGLANK